MSEAQPLPAQGSGIHVQATAKKQDSGYRVERSGRITTALLDHVKELEDRVLTSQAMRKHVEKQISIAFAAGAPAREMEYLGTQFEAETKKFVDIVWDALLHEIRSRLTTDVVMSIVATTTRGGTHS